MSEKTVNKCVGLASTSSSKTNGNVTLAEREIRSYELRVDSAMTKKLDATERPDLEMEMTGGGLVMKWSAGMYELIKLAADEYYLRDDINCVKKIVEDKNGHVVEMKYRVNIHARKQIHYCLNMYNTKCSCLINGKGLATFIETDVQQLLQLVQHKLSAENTSIGQVNSSIRNLVHQYFARNSAEFQSTNESDKSSRLISNNSMTMSDEPTKSIAFDTTVNSDNLETSEVTVVTSDEGMTTDMIGESMMMDHSSKADEIKITPCDTSNQSTNFEIHKVPDNADNSIRSVTTMDSFMQTDVCINTVDVNVQTDETEQSLLLRKLVAMMNGLQQTVNSFIQETRLEYGKIKDEVICIKRSVRQSQDQTQETVDSMAESNKVLSSEIERTLQTIHRRVQGIQDQIKSLSIRSSTELQQTNTNNTVPKQPVTINPSQNLSRERENKTRNDENWTLHSVPTRQPTRNGTVNERHHRPYQPQPQRKYTLIIGDSILKNIQTRGLNNTTLVRTMRGRKIHDVCDLLNNRLREDVGTVVIYIGGNNAASDNADINKDTNELKETVKNLLQQGRKVFLSTVAPRSDCNISTLNSNIHKIGRETSCGIIESDRAFVYGNGSIARHYFNSDGIHLSPQGTRMLISTINRVHCITRRHQQNDDRHYNRSTQPMNFQQQATIHCFHCGLSNHVSRDCRRRRW